MSQLHGCNGETVRSDMSGLSGLRWFWLVRNVIELLTITLVVHPSSTAMLIVVFEFFAIADGSAKIFLDTRTGFQPLFSVDIESL